MFRVPVVQAYQPASGIRFSKQGASQSVPPDLLPLIQTLITHFQQPAAETILLSTDARSRITYGLPSQPLDSLGINTKLDGMELLAILKPGEGENYRLAIGMHGRIVHVLEERQWDAVREVMKDITGKIAGKE